MVRAVRELHDPPDSIATGVDVAAWKHHEVIIRDRRGREAADATWDAIVGEGEGDIAFLVHNRVAQDRELSVPSSVGSDYVCSDDDLDRLAYCIWRRDVKLTAC